VGIESDQVVYEYLSRVGDVAQQRQLPSATRMRLVSELRDEIDRCRARAAVDSPAAVRRILDRLGSPDELVAAAGGGAGNAGTAAGQGGPQAPAAAVPVQREPGPTAPEGAEDPGEQRRRKGLRRVVPRPRPNRPQAGPPPSGRGLPPHLATAAELGGGATRPDWWRTDGSDSPFGIGDDVPGFVGGVEIPDLLKAPPKDTAKPEDTAKPQEPGKEAEPAPAADAAAAGPGPASGRRRLVLLPRPAGRWSNPLLLLAAALLLAGAVLGNWVALLLGWIIAYGSRRLTPTESKWAVLYLPGLALAAGVGWLWGRGEGRWGDPIAQGRLNDAVAQTWPWVVRGAAALSALFLVWRSQRKR
jgi:hypothetical protein